MNSLLRTPVLTRRRVWLALGIAAVADVMQALLVTLGPVGWAAGEGIDVVVMILLTYLLGFHPLFLPTFIAELIPGVDLLPTWTACVAIVIALRRKQQQVPSPAPPPAGAKPPGDYIDV